MTQRSLYRAVLRFLAAEDGPAAVEYAVMLALIVTVCASVIGVLGLEVNAICERLCDVLAGNPM